MCVCVCGNLCRLVSCYAFLRRETWERDRVGRQRQRRAGDVMVYTEKEASDSYIGHDCLIAVSMAGLLMFKEQWRRKIIRKYPPCYCSRRVGASSSRIDRPWSRGVTSTHVLAQRHKYENSAGFFFLQECWHAAICNFGVWNTEQSFWQYLAGTHRREAKARGGNSGRLIWSGLFMGRQNVDIVRPIFRPTYP